MAGVLEEYLSSLRSYRLPGSELERVQEERFRGLVSFAFTRVPYYHRVMKSRGLGPSDFNHLADLRRIPLLSKADILSNPEGALLAKGVPLKDKRTTSGTTGPPVTFYRGPLSERRIIALRLRRMHLTGVHWWEKAAYVTYSVYARSEKASMWRVALAQWPSTARDMVAGYRVVQIGPRNSAAVSRLLLRYRPSILRGRPSYLRRLIRFVKEYDPSFVAKRIFTEGEVLTRGTRNDLHSAYGGEVFDEYGCTEVSSLGADCRYHAGLHLNADYFFFEFLGRDGEQASEGERAELVLTGLVDDAMPLLRYRLGDYVVKDAAGVCRCGTSFPTLKRVEGRATDGLVTAKGEIVPPNFIVEHLETDLGLRDFQLVQEGETDLLLRVNGGVDEGAARSIREFASSVLGAPVRLRTVPWREGEMPTKLRPVMMSTSVEALQEGVTA